MKPLYLQAAEYIAKYRHCSTEEILKEHDLSPSSKSQCLTPLEMDSLIQNHLSDERKDHLKECGFCNDLYNNLQKHIANSQRISSLKEIIKKHQNELWDLEKECTHEFTFRKVDSLFCDTCGKNIGWYCEHSPDKTCHYECEIFTENKKKYIELINRQQFRIVPLPHHYHEDCIFCCNPNERK